MFDIVKFDYNETMLHKSIEHIYSNKNIQFNQFDILTAIKTIKDRINEENAQDLIKYVIKDSTSEQMFFYTQKILQNNYKKVCIQIPTEDEEEKDRIIENLNDMFMKVIKIVSNHLIQYIQNNFDIDDTRNKIKTN